MFQFLIDLNQLEFESHDKGHKPKNITKQIKGFILDDYKNYEKELIKGYVGPLGGYEYFIIKKKIKR